MSMKRFNGTDYVDCTTIKRFDGTNWITANTTQMRHDKYNWNDILHIPHMVTKSIQNVNNHSEVLLAPNKISLTFTPNTTGDCYIFTLDKVFKKPSIAGNSGIYVSSSKQEKVCVSYGILTNTYGNSGTFWKYTIYSGDNGEEKFYNYSMNTEMYNDTGLNTYFIKVQSNAVGVEHNVILQPEFYVHDNIRYNMIFGS